MLIQDRRRCRPPALAELRALLNTTQLVSLTRLEKDGWRLRFVRRERAQLPVPVLTTRDNAHAVMRPDGFLDETPPLALRV